MPKTALAVSSAPVLAPTLVMGPVALNVRNLAHMKEFYTDVIGLSVLKDEPHVITLGSGITPIIELYETPNLPLPSSGDAGLYHLAILFASRGGLARALKRVFTLKPDLFSGSADHLVSDAFYLSDPEMNGIELYRDRPEDTWQWQDGQVTMDAVFLSPEHYIREHAWRKDGDDARMGHVHLKVGDIDEAREFYVNTLGFDIVAHMPSALFVSVNKYHHHLGMNTWESAGAGPRPQTLGLCEFSIILPSTAFLTALELRLKDGGIAVKMRDREMAFDDPWGNRIRIRV